MSITDNVAEVRRTIERAALAVGRDPAEITLCAATKMNDTAKIREAVMAGVTVCGENRVQELLEKLPQGAYTGAELHFIGHLQTNKVRQVVGRVSLIQSVSSEALLSCIDRAAQRLGIVQDVLLEVNIGQEASKSGFRAEEMMQVMDQMHRFPSVRVRGLMAIPPICENIGDNRRFFAEMRNLFVDITAKKDDNGVMNCLSMGMSGDYADAISEGATLVRVGTAIFGARDYSKRSI